MMMMTMFEEDVMLAGKFDADGKYIPGVGSGYDAGFANVDAKAWYAPYLGRANEYGLVPSGNNWTIAQKISDKEISSMISLYSEYIMDITTDTLKHAVITTSSGRYMIDWKSDGSMSIHKK
jgi:hypothetical protein